MKNKKDKQLIDYGVGGLNDCLKILQRFVLQSRWKQTSRHLITE